METGRLSPEQIQKQIKNVDRKPKAETEKYINNQENPTPLYSTERETEEQNMESVNTFYEAFPASMKTDLFPDHLKNTNFITILTNQLNQEKDSYRRSLLLNLIFDKLDDMEKMYRLTHPNEEVDFRKTDLGKKLSEMQREAKNDFSSKYQSKRIALDEEYDQAGAEIYKNGILNEQIQNLNTEDSLEEKERKMRGHFGDLEAKLKMGIFDPNKSEDEKQKLFEEYESKLQQEKLARKLAQDSEGYEIMLDFETRWKNIKNDFNDTFRSYSEDPAVKTKSLKPQKNEKATGEL